MDNLRLNSVAGADGAQLMQAFTDLCESPLGFVA